VHIVVNDDASVVHITVVNYGASVKTGPGIMSVIFVFVIFSKVVSVLFMKVYGGMEVLLN
jgi:hypothetical protein